MTDLPDEPGPEVISRISALVDTGNDAFLRGEFPAAHALFDQAVEAATRYGRTLDLRIQALANRASTADRMGDHPAAIASFHEALDLCDRLAALVATDPADTADTADTAAVTVLRASVLVNLAQALTRTGELDEARTVLERTRALVGGAERGPDTADLLIGCLVALTAITIEREQWARAHELAAESLDVVLRHRPELAGRPLLNLSAIHLATGRPELAEDFTHQAIAAFEASETPAGLAEAQQSLAQMYLRSGRPALAEPLLTACQTYFERTGMGHQSGIGLDLLGLLAALRGDPAGANTLYVRAVARFEESGAVVAAAEVRVRLAAVLHAEGRYEESEAQLALALAAFATSGLGPRCAQTDFYHATLLEHRLSGPPGRYGPPGGSAPDPVLLGRAVGLAVPAALAIDAVRFTLADGGQRERWNRTFAEPAMRLAFRLATRAGAAELVAELIESRCAGTPLLDGSSATAGPAEDPDGDPAVGAPFPEPPDFLGPLSFPGADRDTGEEKDAFRLGAALSCAIRSAARWMTSGPGHFQLRARC
ncbi:tetratricopeptide repeat protein [Streptomyces sp. NPDC050804]|uniref:tetratricopeptide repeat protein n=1 Tax=Streptomyces sp. NPDC050804 TaxID=3154745 RepID=UPI003445F938